MKPQATILENNQAMYSSPITHYFCLSTDQLFEITNLFIFSC